MSESREDLGTHPDLYQIHSATTDGAVLEGRAGLDELARLRSEGLRIGLSLTGPRQGETLRRAPDVVVTGERLFDCVQATWTLPEPSAGAVLEEARSAGLGVIVKEAPANGRLTGRNDEPSSASTKQVLEGWSSRLGTTPDALALAAALARSWADVVLSGAATSGQLTSNLAALAMEWDDEFDEGLGPLAESPEEYKDTRSRLPWDRAPRTEAGKSRVAGRHWVCSTGSPPSGSCASAVR